MSDLVLASASPRRRELLARIGLRFRVAPADIAEIPRPGEEAGAFAGRAAAEKAAAVAAAWRDDFVLAADTVVVLDGAILGKPRDREDARAMLLGLRGRGHVVATGTCIVGPGGARRARVVRTEVAMRAFGLRELESYLDSGEWTDKAGGYGVQERAAALVTTIAGSYTNVVGLPLSEVLEDLLALGAIDEGALHGRP
ncbi:MAG TPA: Maf family protein [Polyangia bacterium]|jgi:septum formation protein